MDPPQHPPGQGGTLEQPFSEARTHRLKVTDSPVMGGLGSDALPERRTAKAGPTEYNTATIKQHTSDQ